MLEIGRTERGPARLTLQLRSGQKLLVERDEPPVLAPDLSDEERESILATGCYSIQPAERKPAQATIPRRRRGKELADGLGERDDQEARADRLARLGEAEAPEVVIVTDAPLTTKQSGRVDAVGRKGESDGTV